MNAIIMVSSVLFVLMLPMPALAELTSGDYYITNGAYMKTTDRNVYGFKISLQDIYNVSFRQADGSAVGEIPSEIIIDSLTLYTSNAGSSGYKTTFKIALCLWSSDDSAGTLLAVSQEAQASAGSKLPMVFTFATDMTLDTSQTYQVFFVYDTTTEENWDYNSSIVNKGITTSLTQTSSGDSCVYTDNNLSTGNYVPLFFMQDGSPHFLPPEDNVPEPAAFAMSFVGVAGLLLRRRRICASTQEGKIA